MRLLYVEVPVKPRSTAQMLVVVFIKPGRLLWGEGGSLGRRQSHLSQTPTVVCLSAAIYFGFRPSPSPSAFGSDGQGKALWARWQDRASNR